MMWRKIRLYLLVLFVSLVIYHRELIGYGLIQAAGQLQILWGAEPIGNLINKKTTPDSLKVKLLVINSIKSYAEKIGLEVNDSYTKVYDQRGKPILWNVSACAPYEFKSYEWRFPFLGSLSYKGFFDLDQAKKEARRLDKLGYDIRIRTVGAWSTLGWFNDPIMSNQLYKSEGDLAETILHELTHATIFHRDSLTFNENLASFIGKKATIGYLKQTYGDSSRQLLSYLYSETDTERFRNHLLNGKDLLDSLYRNLLNEPDDSVKESRKNSLIRAIINSLDTISFHDSFYYSLFEDRPLPNNAYFMGFNRYYSYQEELEKLLDGQSGDLSLLIDFLKSDAN